MMASFTSSFMATFSTLPNETQAFIIIIGVMTGLMAGPFYNNRTLVYGPTILTMVGIFGCFLGISLGLMQFKTTDIQGSVPSLVDGIKTAFWASVSGVGGALVVKMRFLIFGPPKLSAEGTIAEATVDDLALLLRGLHQSLAGKEDSTLLSQTKLLRQENNDGLVALKTSLDSYMEKIADSNSKALIDALKEVIRDFNAKINEQFGENFKQLNSAVEKILTWQETYRQQMSEMIDQQTTTSKNMSEATARYSEIVGHSESFVTAANNLSSLINTLDLQRDQITHSIKSLGELLATAGGNLPKIEAHVIEMTRQVETGVRKSNDQIEATVTAMTVNLQTAHSEMKNLLLSAAETASKEVTARSKQLNEQITSTITAATESMLSSHSEMKRLLVSNAEAANKEVNDRSKQLNEQVTSTVTSATQNLLTSHSEMKRLLVEAAEAANKDVNTHMKQLSENTQKQVVALDKALSDELTKSIQTLGEHLTALSRRFVEDYTPLTERLKVLVQTASRVQ